MATKQHDIIIFFWCFIFWACLVCTAARYLTKGHFRCSHFGVVVCVALGLPLTLATGRMIYLSIYEQYTLGINYGIALAELIAPGWFVDINLVH